MDEREESTWEIVNYVIALAIVVGIGAIWYARRRSNAGSNADNHCDRNADTHGFHHDDIHAYTDGNTETLMDQTLTLASL